MQCKYNALPAVLVIVATVTSVWALARGVSSYDVSWYTIDGGGGTFSTGGGYELVRDDRPGGRRLRHVGRRL